MTQAAQGQHVRSSSNRDITFHGVTLTVWTHAESTRAATLKAVKARMNDSKTGFDSLRSNPVIPPRSTSQRSAMPWAMHSAASETDLASEILSESEADGPLERRMMAGIVAGDFQTDDMTGILNDGGEIFWMPYAVTLGTFHSRIGLTCSVSRHPIYDVMQDYLRLSVCQLQSVLS